MHHLGWSMFDGVDKYRFEDFITDTQQARSGDALLDLLKRAVGAYGYDRISLWVVNDPDLPQQAHERGILHNFPEDVRGFYKDSNAHKYDPIVLAQRAQPRSLDWEAFEHRSHYKPEQTRLYQVAREGGLNHGLSTPLWSQRGLAASLGLASSERKDAVRADLDMISALSAQFYISFKRLYGTTPSVLSVPTLSAKESEILTWVAAGKTDEEIAIILGISRNTVDTHMRHIFAKMDAKNRVTAVVKGIMQGHIRP
jgi:LuxR family quorum sensing-dependent transcriptional regulator